MFFLWNSVDDVYLLNFQYCKAIMEQTPVFCFPVSSFFWNYHQSALFQLFYICNQTAKFCINQSFTTKFQAISAYVREHGIVWFTDLKLYLMNIKKIEQSIFLWENQKKKEYQRKWRVNENILSGIKFIVTCSIFIFLTRWETLVFCLLFWLICLLFFFL